MREYPYNISQAFLNQYFEGVGNFTEERHEIPEPAIEEFTARIKKADAEILARRKIKD